MYIYIYIHLVSSNSDSLGENPCPNFVFFRILGPHFIFNRDVIPIFLVKKYTTRNIQPWRPQAANNLSVTSQPVWPNVTEL